MPRQRRILVRGGFGAAAALILAAGFAVQAGDGEKAGHDLLMLGGTPQRNMANPTAGSLPTEWAVQDRARKNVKWLAQLGKRGYASPVVADGKVFVATNNEKPRDPKVTGSKGVLLCFRESDGEFQWQLTHDMPPEEIVREAGGDGLCSTPCIDGKNIYYVTPAAVVVCADFNGKIVWQYDMIKELGVFPCYIAICSPLVVGDLVFVTTGNGRNAEFELPAPEAPSFIALNKKDGTLKWKDNSPGKGVLEGQWSNPAYGVVNGKPQVLFAGGDGWLRAFEPETGKPIWKFDCNPKDAGEFKPGGRAERSYLVATPVVHDNKVYVGTGQNPEDGPGIGHLWCVDMTRTGDVSPELEPGKPNPNSAVVWHYGGKTPPGSDRDYVFGRTMGAVAIHDGVLYASELDGFLHSLDAKTGKPLWVFDLKASVWGSPYVADGKVYQGTDDGVVYVLAHGRAEKKLAENEMERPIKATVVSANGVIYVVTDTQLWAIAKN